MCFNVRWVKSFAIQNTMVLRNKVGSVFNIYNNTFGLVNNTSINQNYAGYIHI